MYPAATKLRTALHVMLADSVPLVTHPVHALANVQQVGIRQRLISLVLQRTTASHAMQADLVPVATHPAHALVSVQQVDIRQRQISLVLPRTTASHASQEHIQMHLELQRQTASHVMQADSVLQVTHPAHALVNVLQDGIQPWQISLVLQQTTASYVSRDGTSMYPAAFKLQPALPVMQADSVPVVTHPVHALVNVQQDGTRQRQMPVVQLRTTVLRVMLADLVPVVTQPVRALANVLPVAIPQRQMPVVQLQTTALSALRESLVA
jgi:hypothetical protein